jgi:hypothetical protein
VSPAAEPAVPEVDRFASAEVDEVVDASEGDSEDDMGLEQALESVASELETDIAAPVEPTPEPAAPIENRMSETPELATETPEPIDSDATSELVTTSEPTTTMPPTMPSLESTATPLTDSSSSATTTTNTTSDTTTPAPLTIPILETPTDKRPLEDGSSEQRKSKRMRLQTPKAAESPVFQSHAPVLPPPPLPIRDVILTPTQALAKV